MRDFRIRLFPEMMLFSLNSKLLELHGHVTELNFIFSWPYLWHKETLSSAKWTRTCLKLQNSNFVLHPSTQRLCLLQPVLDRLESHKQANKPVNVHISVQRDTYPDKRSNYKLRGSNQPQKQEQRPFHKPWNKNREQN